MFAYNQQCLKDSRMKLRSYLGCNAHPAQSETHQSWDLYFHVQPDKPQMKNTKKKKKIQDAKGTAAAGCISTFSVVSLAVSVPDLFSLITAFLYINGIPGQLYDVSPLYAAGISFAVCGVYFRCH